MQPLVLLATFCLLVLCYRYRIKLCEKILHTKRKILSLVVRIYDPVVYSFRKSKKAPDIPVIATRRRVTGEARINQGTQVCTIPKLELESAVLLVELFKYLRDNLGDTLIKFIGYTMALFVGSTAKN